MTDVVAKRKRIGVVINSFHPGVGHRSGGFVHISEVARRWPRFEVWVFGPEAARAAVAEAIPTATFIAPSLKPSGRSSLPRLLIERLFALVFAISQRREIRACDVVVSTTGFLADVIPTLFARRGRAAIVVQHLQTAPWRRAGSLIDNTIAYATERLGLLLARRNAGVFFYNDRNDLRSLRLDDRRTRFVRLSHGVDHLPFARDPIPIFERRDAIFVGRLHPTKGIDDLLAAWQIVAKRQPSATLRLIGTGTAIYRQHLDRRVEQLELTGRVEFLGPADERRKCDAIRSARIFTFPSLEEGWGIAIAEALASGTPCVTYDLAVYRDVFTSGRIEIARRDVAAFARAILALLEDDALWDATSRAASRLAESFTWRRAAEIYEDAFEELISQSRTWRDSR